MAYRAAPLPTSAKVTPYVAPQTIITQFQAGNGFSFQSADASSSVNDTGNFVIGTQDAKLVTAGAGATTYLLHKGLPAVDMTARQFVVVIECDDPAHISTGTFQFLAGSGASTSTTYQWQLYSAGTVSQNVIQAGLWVYYTLSFADASVNGSPVKTALTDFYVRLNDDNTGNKVTVRVNAIYAVPDSSGAASSGGQGYPDGVVSVCFDDGFSSQLTDGKPVMDSYGWQPSTYVIWDQIGGTGRLTLTEYLAMQDISGWDVNCHSLTDADHSAGFDNISLAELETNVSQQAAIMAAAGFQGKGSAYPKGQLTPAVRSMLRKYFSYVRGTFNKTLETWPPADIFNLRAVSSISPLSGGYSPSSISGANGLIDETVTYKRWLILTFHKIIGNVTSCNNTTGTTYRVIYTDTSPPYNTGASLTLQGFSPAGLNGTYTITGTGTTGGFGYADVSIVANPGNASVQGTALSATTDCDLASYTAILAKISSAGLPVRTVAQVVSSLGGYSTAAPVTSAASYTMAPYDAGVLADSTSGTVTVTLPDATRCADGRTRYVKDWKGQSATHNITIATTSAQTIDGASSLTISAAYAGYDVVSDGSNWAATATVGIPAALSGSAPLADATTPAAGSSALAPRQDHQHPRVNWSAPDHNLITWTFDPVIAASSTILGTAGTVFCAKMHLPVAQNITSIVMDMTTAGSALTSGQCFAALYQGPGGLLLGTTADQSSTWTASTGLKTMAISGGPVAAAAGDVVAALWYNGTSAPTFSRAAGNALVNTGLSAPNSRFGSANTAVTTTAPGTLGTMSALSVAYWVALS